MTRSAPTDHWIAANHNGKDLVLWHMQGDQSVAEFSVAAPAPMSAEKLGQLAAESGLAPAPVFAVGLTDAPTLPVPTHCHQLTTATIETEFAVVHALAQVSQTKPHGYLSEAAMQISGFLSLNPNWDGVICTVGTRSAWSLVSADEIVSFDTTLTPHLAGSLGCGFECDSAVLADAIADGLSRPEALATRLSAAWGPDDTTANLSSVTSSKIWGHLIGAELAATRPYWLGQNLALIAPSPLAKIYASAFETQYLPVTVARPDATLLAGLSVARRKTLGSIA